MKGLEEKKKQVDRSVFFRKRRENKKKCLLTLTEGREWKGPLRQHIMQRVGSAKHLSQNHLRAC